MFLTKITIAIIAGVGLEIHICNRIGFMTFVQNSLPKHVCHSATVPMYLYNKMIHRQTNSKGRKSRLLTKSIIQTH